MFLEMISCLPGIERQLFFFAELIVQLLLFDALLVTSIPFVKHRHDAVDTINIEERE